MMAKNNIFIMLLILQYMSCTYAQQSERRFRKDYTYLNTTESFYKIHTRHRTWGDAKKLCEMEGASLFFPEDEREAMEVIAFWNRTQPKFLWVYIGVSDLLVKDVFETIDGRPIMDVYSSWGPGEPNDEGGFEDCVKLRRDGPLNDASCDQKNPFICKKPLVDLQWSKDCDMPRTDYTYDHKLGRCYKFHSDPKNWTDAFITCYNEHSYLAVINSQEEADYLVQMTEKGKNNDASGLTLNGVVYLGFHNRDGQGWKTVKGENIGDSGYAKWGVNQPDGGDNELCGSMFFNGQLNNVACSQRCFFICEHDIASLSQGIEERFDSLFI